MQRLTERKMNLVIRETRLDELISRHNTLDQARFYVEHLGADFSDYVAEDKQYKSAIRKVESILRKMGRVQVLQRRFIPNFIFGRDDLIIVVGQDGLLANTLKYLDEQPVIGINPDPDRWGGELLPFGVDALEGVVIDVLAHRRDTAKISIAKAVLDDGRSLYAVNDLFVGAKTHVSAKYVLSIDGKTESQSSSGVIVSTGLGSTGWLKSILAGAVGITGALLERKIEMASGHKVPWDAPYLNFSVREPFPSKTTSASVVYGKITPSSPLTLVSQMSGNGVIFSDGIENDFLEFNSGMTAKVSLAQKCGHVVV